MTLTRRGDTSFRVLAKVAPPAVAGTPAALDPAGVTAKAVTSRAVKAFTDAVMNSAQLNAAAWGRSVSPPESSVLISQAKASIIDIDLAATRAHSSAQRADATKAIKEVYATLTSALPDASKSKDGWVGLGRESDLFLTSQPLDVEGRRHAQSLEANASTQNRKNLSSYLALGALVAKLTKSPKP